MQSLYNEEQKKMQNTTTVRTILESLNTIPRNNGPTAAKWLAPRWNYTLAHT